MDEEHILQFFTWRHLPHNLGMVSKPFCELAHAIVHGDNCAESGTCTFGPPLQRNPERTVALRKLLEAKDAAVRAAIAAPTAPVSDQDLAEPGGNGCEDDAADSAGSEVPQASGMSQA